ncbi:4-pyridoxate dehydrogenase [Variovorax boronicumulans]|uniref:GMC family oxidoreductase n=1 Tax=Variovorax boronicumulans TaxID=436515 RepID=UPI00247445F6|nr:GMC family oxidoreductase N-terminal domain-containing protein [Variovorax boronicumulans]MDH6169991.1 4-pyridoxate dehydrogenase [Variovorax boronicumulans]
MADQEYDYVIVGAGSAGCTVAARLAEHTDDSVLVMEAGGSDRSPMLSIPLAWGLVFRHRLFDWGYDTEPERELNGRRIECARGRVVGGSSSVNGMVYARGIPADYDAWAEQFGLTGWAFQDVLPYFIKSEHWPVANAPWRGNAGPLSLTQLHDPDPLVQSFVEACAQAGFGQTDDYNGPQSEGFGPIQATIHKGRRSSAARAYLRNAPRAGGVALRTGVVVTRIVLEAGRATGIEFLDKNRLRRVHARKEVILSAGVFNSPKLLMLSGIGPADELRRHRIDVNVDLPGVGDNLQDHLACEVRWRRRDQGVLHRAMRIDRAAMSMARAFFCGKGVASSMPLGAIGLLRTVPGLPHPDAQLLLGTAPLSAAPYLNPFVRPYLDAFTIKGMVVQPESRGRVGLRSADPLASPQIEQRLMSAPRDIEVARSVIRVIREIANQPGMQRHIAEEVAPGPSVDTDSAVLAYLRSTASTLHHPVGTCRMGRSEERNAVLDSDMRVFGVQQLRVIDASSMPRIVRGPVNAPVIMMAEKIAHEMLIRSRQR